MLDNEDLEFRLFKNVERSRSHVLPLRRHALYKKEIVSRIEDLSSHYGQWRKERSSDPHR